MDLYNILGGISGLTILYVLLMVLLSWSIIGIKGHWITKGLFMAIAIWFSITLYHSFHNFMGWPTEETISTKYSQLIWFQIKEPSKVTNHPGAIYLWVRELSSKEKPEQFADLVSNAGNDLIAATYDMTFSSMANSRTILSWSRNRDFIDFNGDGFCNEEGDDIFLNDLAGNHMWDFNDANGNNICDDFITIDNPNGECEYFEDEGEEASTVFGMSNEEVFFRNSEWFWKISPRIGFSHVISDEATFGELVLLSDSTEFIATPPPSSSVITGGVVSAAGE